MPVFTTDGLPPLQGEGVVYHWSLAWNILPWVPAVLVLLLLLRRANLRLGAWALLIPYLPLMALFTAIELTPVGDTLAAGKLYVVLLAAVLALVDLLPRPEGGTRWRRLFLFMLFVSLAGPLCIAGTPADPSLISTILATGVAALVLVFSLWIAARSARKRKSVGVFLFWLFFLPPLLMIPVALLFGVYLFIVFAQEMGVLFALGPLIMCPVMGAMLGVGIDMLMFPFIILVCASPLYRTRFFEAFDLPRASGAPEQGPVPAAAMAGPPEEV